GRPSSFLQLRLFPRSSKLFFEGRVHESVAGRAKDGGFRFNESAIKIIHTGYETAVAREAKMKRNFSILEAELEKNPDNTIHRFLLANTFLANGRREEALVHYQAIADNRNARGQQEDVYVRTLVELAKGNGEAGRLARAEEWARKAVVVRADDMEAQYELARILFHRGNYNDALTTVNRAFASKPYLSSVGIDFIAVRAGLYELAIRLQHLSQKHLEAAEFVRKGLEELPCSHEMARVAASFYIDLERFDEAEDVYRRAALRMPDLAGEFNGCIRGLRMAAARGREGTAAPADYLKAVPRGTGSVLVVGTGSGLTALELKKQGVEKVHGLLLPGDNRDLASVRFDALFASTDELVNTGFEYDFALFGDQLSRLDYPEAVLRTVRGRLKPDGRALFACTNVQNYTVLASLGYGLWNYGETGMLRTGYCRLFTRQTFAEYLDAHGFQIDRIHEIVDPLYTQQVRTAPAKLVNLGKTVLDLEGLDDVRMRDFFVIQFIVTAAKKVQAGDVTAGLHIRGDLAGGMLKELNKKGLKLLEEKDYAGAAGCFYKVLRSDSGNSEAYANLGLVEWYQGNVEDAYFLFKKSVDLCPDDEDGLLNLWDAAQKTGREAEARVLLESALTRTPGLSEVRRGLDAQQKNPL
ncbi:MAG: tetratricopeptide repeat protein, partial [Fibrobacterota bacterium]